MAGKKMGKPPFRQFARFAFTESETLTIFEIARRALLGNLEYYEAELDEDLEDLMNRLDAYMQGGRDA